MRSPADMDIVQIDISTKCHLKCSNCTRLIPHQTQRADMELETFERAVQSMEGWNGPNKLIGIIAGEPTLHANFEQISLRFERALATLDSLSADPARTLRMREFAEGLMGRKK